VHPDAVDLGTTSPRERGGRGVRHRAGIPPATYFSAGKVQWILENVDGVREAADKGDAIFGNTDAWGWTKDDGVGSVAKTQVPWRCIRP
jgi:glycerol kinase